MAKTSQKALKGPASGGSRGAATEVPTDGGMMLGRVMALRRHTLGISREELAAQARVSVAVVEQIESGVPPSTEELRSISSVLPPFRPVGEKPPASRPRFHLPPLPADRQRRALLVVPILVLCAVLGSVFFAGDGDGRSDAPSVSPAATAPPAFFTAARAATLEAQAAERRAERLAARRAAAAERKREALAAAAAAAEAAAAAAASARKQAPIDEGGSEPVYTPPPAPAPAPPSGGGGDRPASDAPSQSPDVSHGLGIHD
jgi:hypothetical protein